MFQVHVPSSLYLLVSSSAVNYLESLVAEMTCLRRAGHTRSSAIAKSTARPSSLVGVLYDIYRETNNRATANQPLVRNWP